MRNEFIHWFLAIMRKTLAILTMIFWVLNGFAQTDSIRGNKFELVGKTINEISLPPGCGIFAWGTVVEFEIIQFSNSEYKLDSIGVIFTCPDFYKDGFFGIGKIYTLIVADENQADFGWVILNESTLSKYNLIKNLWVIEAVKK